MAYMDNPQSVGKRARRVIPGYLDLASDYLGMAQIILAFLCLIISLVGFIIKAFPTAPATGILLAVPLFICGVFGVMAGVRKETWAIACYFGCSILCLLLSLVLLASAIAGTASEYERDSNVSVAVREGVDITLVALALLSGASVVASLVLTGMHMVRGCCRCFTGAKYVHEPPVEFSNPTSAATTPENAGYNQTMETAVTIATVQHRADNGVATNQSYDGQNTSIAPHDDGAIATIEQQAEIKTLEMTASVNNSGQNSHNYENDGSIATISNTNSSEAQITPGRRKPTNQLDFNNPLSGSSVS